MLKEPQFDPSGMKMIFESQHQAFNHFVNLITTGNVIANGQSSWHVRPFTETRSWGYDREPGDLQAFDLSHYSELENYFYIRKAVEKYTHDQKGILYYFYHYNGNRKIVHGWVLTDAQYRLFDYWVTGPSCKSESVILEAMRYIVEHELKPDTNEIDFWYCNPLSRLHKHDSRYWKALDLPKETGHA